MRLEFFIRSKVHLTNREINLTDRPTSKFVNIIAIQYDSKVFMIVLGSYLIEK